MPEQSPLAPHESPAPRWQPLGPIDRRIAGVLVEKAKTTPESYPMSLNAIVNASNQKSNRHPVMQIEPDDAEEALETAPQSRSRGNDPGIRPRCEVSPLHVRMAGGGQGRTGRDDRIAVTGSASRKANFAAAPRGWSRLSTLRRCGWSWLRSKSSGW